MTEKCKPGAYADKFTSAIHALLGKCVKAGATEKVEPMEEPGTREPGNVVDLTALLKQSLGKKAAAEKPGKPAANPTAATKKVSTRQPARKRA